MTSGGIIVVHDYRNAELPGAGLAVNEFLEENENDFDFHIAASMAVLIKR
jgi:hypothetical protein